MRLMATCASCQTRTRGSSLAMFECSHRDRFGIGIGFGFAIGGIGILELEDGQPMPNAQMGAGAEGVFSLPATFIRGQS